MKIPSSCLLLAAVFSAAGSLSADEKNALVAPAPELELELRTHLAVSGSNRLRSGPNPVGALSSHEAASSLSARIPLGAADSLGLDLGLHRTELNHGLPGLAPLSHSPLPDELERATVDLAWTHRFDERWSSLVAIGPGLRWADARLGSEAFAVNARAAVVYRQSSALTWTFGATYDSLSQDYRVTPAVSVEWSPSETWTIAVGFPRSAVTCRIAPAFTLALVGEVRGGAYHVARDPLRAADGTRDRLLDDSTLEYYDLRLGCEAAYRLSGRCAITATLGSVLYREANYHKSGLRVTKLRTADATAVYGSVGCSVSF